MFGKRVQNRKSIKAAVSFPKDEPVVIKGIL
jgi:hypothetical protein